MGDRRARRVLVTVAAVAVIAAVTAVGIAWPITRAGETTGTAPAAGTSVPATRSASSKAPAAAPAAEPPPSVPRPGRVGLSSDLFWPSPDKVRDDLQTIAGGGVRWVRADFDWATLQPHRDQWNWDHADTLMRAAAVAGVSVLGILDYSAPWASSGRRGDGHSPPRNNADYAAYAAAVAARFGSRGDFWVQNPTLVPAALALELWNEPWGHWFWQPDPDPTAYAAMAHAAAAAIRAANPSVKILMPGDILQWRQVGTAQWLDRVLAADPGLGALIDVYSVHPYPSPRRRAPTDDSGDAAGSYGRVPQTRAVAIAHGAEHPIWITEIGWSTATRSADGVSEATQAAYLSRAIERALTKWPYVEKVFVFAWGTSNGNMTDSEGNFALRRNNGTLKPAWQAVEDAAARWPT
jgi:hypothetical protein